MSDNAHTIITANAEAIELFVSRYLPDNGMAVQLVEAIAKELFGTTVNAGGTIPEEAMELPQQLVVTAVNDVVSIGAFSGVVYKLDRVLDGALSFEFLVRYAHKIDPTVMPPDLIPSDEVVAAVLEVFHESQRAAQSIES